MRRGDCSQRWQFNLRLTRETEICFGEWREFSVHEIIFEGQENGIVGEFVGCLQRKRKKVHRLTSSTRKDLPWRASLDTSKRCQRATWPSLLMSRAEQMFVDESGRKTSSDRALLIGDRARPIEKDSSDTRKSNQPRYVRLLCFFFSQHFTYSFLGKEIVMELDDEFVGKTVILANKVRKNWCRRASDGECWSNISDDWAG